MPIILPLTLQDVDTISRLADTIWHEQYSGIISSAQIEYMLQQRYHPTLIQAQVLNQNIWWEKLVRGERIIGFACCMQADKPEALKLDKLYIHADDQRKGYGKLLVDDAMRIASDHAFENLILAVNKNNFSAITAYRASLKIQVSRQDKAREKNLSAAYC